MRSDISFRLAAIPFSIFFLILLIWNFVQPIESILFNSLFWGSLLPFSNFAIGHFLTKTGLSKSDNSFLLLVLGGMVLRMFLMLIMIIVALEFLNVSMYSFIFVIFISYVYFLIIEIYHLAIQKTGKISKNN